MRLGLAVSLITLALSLGACVDPATGPASGGRPLSLSFAAAGGPAQAFDRADRLAVTVSTANGVVLDSVMPFSAGGGDVRLRLRLPRDPGDGPASIMVELRLGSEPLFRGSAEGVTLDSSGPIDITLVPVIARIVTSPQNPTINGLGNTIQLAGAAVMATGDTVPNIPLSWSSQDPNIVSSTAAGLVRGLSEGDGRVQVRSGNITAIATVRVRGIVSVVTVSPGTATLNIGGTQQYTFVARDASNNVLVRTANWSSSNDAIVTINTSGLATAKTAGTATIRAEVDGITGTAQVTVRPPVPNMPTNLSAFPSGGTVRLTWTDNANNETSFQVRRIIGSGQPVLVATLGPNATTYSDQPGLDRLLQYMVSACNSEGCSQAAVAQTMTIPAEPSNLDFNRNTYYITGQLVLAWSDNSTAESRFDIEANNSVDLTLPWYNYDTVPMNIQTYSTTYNKTTYTLFRVTACNAAGCSAPSNLIVVGPGTTPGAPDRRD